MVGIVANEIHRRNEIHPNGRCGDTGQWHGGIQMDSKVGLLDQGPQGCINGTNAKCIKYERIQLSLFVECNVIIECRVIVTVRGGQNVAGHIGTPRWDGGPGPSAPARPAHFGMPLVCCCRVTPQ
jgi:hypothetical protein